MDNPELLEEIWQKIDGVVDLKDIETSEDLQKQFKKSLSGVYTITRKDGTKVQKRTGKDNLVNNAKLFFRHIKPIQDSAEETITNRIENAKVGELPFQIEAEFDEDRQNRILKATGERAATIQDEDAIIPLSLPGLTKNALLRRATRWDDLERDMRDPNQFESPSIAKLRVLGFRDDEIGDAQDRAEEILKERGIL